MSAGTIIVEEKINKMPLKDVCQLFREIEYWHEEGVLPQNCLYKQLLNEINKQINLDCKDWLEPAILFAISKKYVEYTESLWETPLKTKPWEENIAQKRTRKRPLQDTRKLLSRTVIIKVNDDSTVLQLFKRGERATIPTFKKEIEQLEEFVLKNNGTFTMGYLPDKTVIAAQYATAEIDNKTMEQLKKYLPGEQIEIWDNAVVPSTD